MRIIITGGGTGGHIYPGISLARQFQKENQGNEIFFVGTETGMEADIIPREGFNFFSLKVKGFKREICFENISAFFLFLGSIFSSVKLIKKIKPDLVIGTGGYVSGSISLVSAMLGVPTFIHEQNALPGITNKALSFFSKIVFASFPESEKYFWKKTNIMCLGNPVRENIWHGNREKLTDLGKISIDKKTILVFGGSKGANAINQAFIDCLNLIDKVLFAKWQILLISGKEDYENMQLKINNSKYHDYVYIVPYLYNIEDGYNLADLVICRSGATTVAELTACGLPSILIPYPYATGNHQMHNAQYLEKQQAATIIPQQELSAKRLASELMKFLANDDFLNTMSQYSKKIGNRTAANDIVKAIYASLKKER